jgi:Na+/melibiose symporter-like transporter
MTAAALPPDRGGLLGLLRQREYLRLWLADGLWWQSMWMEQLVLGWVALELTNSAWWVAVVAFCRAAPLPLVGLFGPALGERWRRAHLILVLQGINLGGGAALLILHLLGGLAYWHLAAVALVNGAAWALDWPTRRALIPDLVGRERVVDGMVLESSLQSLTRLTGPLLAGSAMAHLGIGGALGILVGLSAAAFVILSGLRSDSRSPAPPKGVVAAWRRLREGLSYVRRQPGILGTLAITVIMNAWAFPFQALLPVIARDVLGQGPMGLGLLGAANGAGALVGMVLVNRGRRRRSNELLFAGGSLLACIGPCGLSMSTSVVLSMAALVVAGVGQAGFSIMQSSIILVRASDEMRSRAMGALVLAIGSGPLGRVQGGAMAAAWGAPVAVGAMAASAALAIVVVAVLVGGFVRGGPPAPAGAENA